MSKLYVIANPSNASVIDFDKETKSISAEQVNGQLELGAVTKEGLLNYTEYFQEYNFEVDASTGNDVIKYSVEIEVSITEKILFEGNPHDTLVFLCAQTTEWNNAQVVTPEEYGRIIFAHQDKISDGESLAEYLGYEIASL